MRMRSPARAGLVMVLLAGALPGRATAETVHGRVTFVGTLGDEQQPDGSRQARFRFRLSLLLWLEAIAAAGLWGIRYRQDRKAVRTIVGKLSSGVATTCSWGSSARSSRVPRRLASCPLAPRPVEGRLRRRAPDGRTGGVGRSSGPGTCRVREAGVKLP